MTLSMVYIIHVCYNAHNICSYGTAQSNVANVCNFIANNKCVSSLLNMFTACVSAPRNRVALQDITSRYVDLSPNGFLS